MMPDPQATRTSFLSSTADSNISNDENDPTSSSTPKTSTLCTYPPSFFVRIPKADLHIHLDGSIRIPTLIDLAKQYGVELPSYDAVELKNTVFPPMYDSLNDYLRGFGYITVRWCVAFVHFSHVLLFVFDVIVRRVNVYVLTASVQFFSSYNHLGLSAYQGSTGASGI